MSLAQDLQTISNEVAALSPIEAMQAMEKSIKDVQDSGTANGINVGEKAPDFTLTNHHGDEVTLYEALQNGPVVLTFYRGSWCPFCNRQLKAYQETLPVIHSLGAQLFAISPQTPDNSLTVKEKNELQFQVLSDINGVVMAKYNLLFDVPSYHKDVYNQIGVDLEAFNGSGNWILPVPATIMIDETGEVRFSYVNANFMKRLEPEEIVEALRNL